MKPRNLLILCVIVVAVAGYIFLYERHQMTTDELEERADKIFPTLEVDQVTEVEIRNSHGRFRLAKDGEDWRLVEPIDFAANSGSVNGLIRSIANLAAERTLSTDEVELAAYGLDEPEMDVKLETGDGSRFALSVGDEAALGSNRAVRRGDEATIVLGPGWWVADLDKGLDDWRSREVVDVLADELGSLDLVSGDDRVRVVRDGETWRLAEPVVDLADGDHVRNLISDLNALRIEQFLGDEAVPEDLGLDEPSFVLDISRSDDGPPIRLEFGVTREDEGATQVACRRGGEELFWVTDRAATRLAKAPVRWRAPKVYDFDTWDAERFTVSSDDSVTLVRSEGIWESADGSEVDHTKVQRRLSALADLEAREFDLVEPGTDVMGTVELALPGDGEGAPLQVVSYTFHRPLTDGGQAMVVVSARDTVMSVEQSAAEEILNDPAQLIKAKEEPPTDDEPVE